MEIHALRFRAVQDKNASPRRGNKREWWWRVYRNFRKSKSSIWPPNAPSKTYFHAECRESVVYGPCGKLPK